MAVRAVRPDDVHHENGQLLTGTMIDYAAPKAFRNPELVTESLHILRGVKGVGEAGTIAAQRPVVNVIVDALSPLGIDHIDMPWSPEPVWHTINTTDGGA